MHIYATTISGELKMIWNDACIRTVYGKACLKRITTVLYLRSSKNCGKLKPGTSVSCRQYNAKSIVWFASVKEELISNYHHIDAVHMAGGLLLLQELAVSSSDKVNV